MLTGLLLLNVLAVQPNIGIGLAMAGAEGSSAASPVTTRPLAANEVLLEVVATGVETRPADRARMNVVVTGRGTTAAAADTARDRIVGRVREAARAAGAAETDVSAPSTTATIVPELPMEIEARPERPGPEPSERTSTGTIEVVLTGADNIVRFRRAVDSTEGARISGTPQLELSDDAPPRRAARVAALARARADAETYAAALNLRVARIVRVTERTGTDFISAMMSEMGGRNMRGLEGIFRDNRNGQVSVIVFIGVDFALAPR